MGTSIIPVRDALARLEREGLVEGMAGRGWRVSRLDAEQLGDLALLREALECQAARLCAARATAEELAELEFLARQVDQAEDQDTSNEREERFHLRLVQIAGSAAIQEAIVKANVLWLTFGRPPSRAATDRLHEGLVEALATRQPDLAEQAMRKHVNPGCHPGPIANGTRTTPP